MQRWGGNVSAIDIFVTQDNINTTKDALEKLQIRFDVLIDNVQDAIDSENPPLSEDNLDAFVGRSGKLNNSVSTLYYTIFCLLLNGETYMK